MNFVCEIGVYNLIPQSDIWNFWNPTQAREIDVYVHVSRRVWVENKFCTASDLSIILFFEITKFLSPILGKKARNQKQKQTSVFIFD